MFSSAFRGTRTPDIFGVNEALYQLSYKGMSYGNGHTITRIGASLKENRRALQFSVSEFSSRIELIVPPEGFEPPTDWVETSYSSTEL